ncbi:MAG: ATPase P [Deltaproteobacteria bacterium]|jgi:soluble P-type ATPase|nr:ATPase P [Deltaproteobacteria bacterium]
MLQVDIPGRGLLQLSYLVLDYNGTMALDGHLLPGVGSLLAKISEILEIHVVTADTFGLARQGLSGLPASLSVLGPSGQTAAKQRFVEVLGPERTCAVGNGRNDCLMLKASALGLAVIGPEGASQASVSQADLVCPDIGAALGLLLNPLRLVAGLRD